jgi:hypothetical protein
MLHKPKHFWGMLYMDSWLSFRCHELIELEGLWHRLPVTGLTKAKECRKPCCWLAHNISSWKWSVELNCGTRQVLRYCPCHQGAGTSEGAVAPLWSRVDALTGLWTKNLSHITGPWSWLMLGAWMVVWMPAPQPMLDRGTRWGLPENDHIIPYLMTHPVESSSSFTFYHLLIIIL